MKRNKRSDVNEKVILVIKEMVYYKKKRMGGERRGKFKKIATILIIR